jgi:hypothetical protein
MQLDFQERQFLNRAVAQARFFERQQLAVQAERLRAEIAAERDAFYAEMARVKAEMLAPFFELQAELERLRNYYHAHRAHVEAKQELAEILRRHAIERAMEATRDPAAPLQ